MRGDGAAGLKKQILSSPPPDRARSRGVDGFGLGLSLAEAVVEGHGGELRLARADDEATRFEVLIPMAGEE